MCGIAGLLYFDPERQVDPALLDRMTDVLAHRGPDGRGTHIDGALGLGHRRLAIIDLSQAAAQPLANEDGTVQVVANGEIYNYLELRAELTSRGHIFRSRSDTEVLVHLYEELGCGLVERLRGMFAFALWDARQRRLLLVRDRFGQKPLYYRLDQRALHFASEVKAILEDHQVLRAADPGAIHDYLTYGYVPESGTAFEGLRKLAPGCLLTVEADGRHVSRRYWSFELTPKRRIPETRRAILRVEEELLELIDEAVRLRMVSDVPLGAFLSGGVDSSTVVASMCRHQNGGVRTFAVGFDQPGWDETSHAERVARHLGTEHEVLTLEPGSLNRLQKIAWHYSDPQADSSCLPTFAVSQLARQRVTVALSGDGGDELFCGYPHYREAGVTESLRSFCRPVRAALWSRFFIYLLYYAGEKSLARQLAYNRRNANLEQLELYLQRIELLSPAMKRELYSVAFEETTREDDSRGHLRSLIGISDGTTFVERCAHADVNAYLPDDILVKVDVASMAYGLECRAPLLDHVLAEYVARLPFELKMSRLATKVVLKRAVRHRLPRETIIRSKMGFGVPLQEWFQSGISSLLREVVLSPRALARGYFRPEVLSRLVDEHLGGKRKHQRTLFTVLMLELWHRIYMDPPQGSAIVAPSGP